MRLVTPNIVVRPFERKDAERLYSISREQSIHRYMPDWADGYTCPQDYNERIDKFQGEAELTPITAGCCYIIALPDTDEMIGMAGVNYKKELCEVEIAYFMSEKYRRNGYTEEAVNALVEWCFEISDINYLILTAKCSNVLSNRLAEKCGFQLLEKRTPIRSGTEDIDHSYFYYRRYRNQVF